MSDARHGGVVHVYGIHGLEQMPNQIEAIVNRKTAHKTPPVHGLTHQIGRGWL